MACCSWSMAPGAVWAAARVAPAVRRTARAKYRSMRLRTDSYIVPRRVHFGEDGMPITAQVVVPVARNAAADAQAGAARISSVDLWRGAIMVLMAIDHVRVYSGVPAGGPTAGVFFTRWVTHFCAPGFVFLAGTAAFLYGRKVADRAELSRYLVTRGLLLVLLELSVIRLSW